MSGLAAGDLNRRITLQRPVADTSFTGAGSGTWQDVVTNLPANVYEPPPSRGEQVTDGVNIVSHPVRIRIRWRPEGGDRPDHRRVRGEDGHDRRRHRRVSAHRRHRA